MSASETETNDLGEDAISDRLQLKSMDEVRKLDKNQIIDYVEKLHEFIKKSNKKLTTCRQTIKELEAKTERPVESGCKATTVSPSQPAKLVSVENVNEDTTKDDEKNDEEISASTAFSFVDEMRQAAEQAQNISNFVYEPTSGLYYDPKTGYYYNAEYGLYYDGNTGCYYSYNQAKNSFEFHSQAQVQDNKCAGKRHETNDNNNEDGDGDNDADDDIQEVEFDEYGGVITDKDMLKQIKRLRDKVKRRQLESKTKSKKKKKKDSKTHKSHHKSKKRRKHAKRVKRTKDYNSNESQSDSDSNGERTKSKKCRREDIEDGELSQSSDSDSSDSDKSNCSDAEDNETDVPVFKASGRFQDIAKKYPPSLRIIVQETNIDNLKVGSLHLITFKGGTLGREGAHDVIIGDVNVSKCHLKFHYDTKKCIYKCADLGSRNGTILNGVRMSVSKAESEPYDLVHGSVLQIGQTKLLCHVHEGNSTCGLCEPGLLIETQPREICAPPTVTLTHKEQLKMLQKKYGLENEKFVEAKTTTGNYNDRAASRRIKVGSTTDKEKTEVASVNTEISSENKGFKMLSKLGWSKGNALGKTNASGGLLAPINVVSNEGKTGLGCEQPAVSVTYTVASKQKLANLKITQERYKRADIFIDSDDTD